jgi:hypothetical protein
MQTFMPEKDMTAIAKSLDYRRLGKQRVECLQILNSILLHRQHGWRHHPIVKMWMPNPAGLAAYGVAICREWIERGYRDTCLGKITNLIKPNAKDMPDWWGREDIIESHRSNLIRKFPEFYGPKWPGTPSDLPYVWAIDE